MSFYTNGPLVLTGGAAPQFNTATRQGFDPRTREMVARASGDPEVGFVSIMSAEPSFSVALLELDTALTNIGFGGKSIIASTGDFTALTQYWTQMKDESDRESGANHLSAAVAKGMIIPTSIEASQDNFASMEVDVHAVYDGTNAPVVWSSGVALPGSISVGNIFTLGPVKINGTTITPEVIQRVQLSLGVDVEKFSGSGEVYPRRAHVKTYLKAFTIETKRSTNLSIYGLGTAFSAGATIVYFRKMALDGDRVADATAAHVKLTLPASQGLILPQGVSGENNAAHGSTIKLVPHKGTNSILTYAVAAIT